MNNRKRWFGLILTLIVCMIGVSSPFQHFAAIPSELRLFSGQQKHLNYDMPVHAKLSFNSEVMRVNGSLNNTVDVDLNKPISLDPLQSGQTKMTMKLFGSIPFKTVKVHVVPDLKVIPGGQTIGVKVKSAGIMVVGHHEVITGKDSKQSPGEQAEIKLGDLIVRINALILMKLPKFPQL